MSAEPGVVAPGGAPVGGPSRRPSRRLLVAGVVLLGVLALVVALLVTRSDAGTPARPGQVVDTGAWNADDAPDPTGSAALTLPPGDLELAVAARTDDLVPSDEDDEGAVPPPDAGTFLPVRWQWTELAHRFDLAAAEGQPFAVQGGEGPRPELYLEQAGTRTVLAVPEPGRPDADPGSQWFHVAVDGGDDLALVVAYDGVEQRVAVTADAELEPGAAGRFAAYEDALREPATPAAAAALLPVDLDPGLVLSYAGGGTADDPGDGDLVVGAADLQPYVAGLGWAPEGQAWLVAPLAVGFYGSVEAGGSSALLVRSSWSLDQAAPSLAVDAAGVPSDTVLLAPPRSGVGAGGILVAAVPGDTTQVDLEVVARTPVALLYDGDLADFPDPVTLTWRGSVPVG